MAEHQEKHGEHGEEESHGGHAHGQGGGHGGGHEEGHEGAPEWLISFADNVALMMGFFVILLAMNMQKPKAGGIGGEDQYPSNTQIDPLDTVIAIRQAFNSPIDPNDPRDFKLSEHMRKKGQGNAQDTGPEGQNRKVDAVVPTDMFNRGGTIPFEEGSTELTESGEELVRLIAARFKGSRWVVEVRGHSSPYETFRDTNLGLELSFRRAQAVANALVEQGLRWEQLHVVACADSDRKKARPSGREEDRVNRRVEVIETKETMPDDPYTRGEGE